MFADSQRTDSVRATQSAAGSNDSPFFRERSIAKDATAYPGRSSSMTEKSAGNAGAIGTLAFARALRAWLQKSRTDGGSWGSRRDASASTTGASAARALHAISSAPARTSSSSPLRIQRSTSDSAWVNDGPGTSAFDHAQRPTYLSGGVSDFSERPHAPRAA